MDGGALPGISAGNNITVILQPDVDGAGSCAWCGLSRMIEEPDLARLQIADGFAVSIQSDETQGNELRRSLGESAVHTGKRQQGEHSPMSGHGLR